MKKRAVRALGVLLLLAVSGCASVAVSDRQPVASGPKLPRPEHIWVYDFAGTPGDLPVEAQAAAAEHTAPQTPAHIETVRQVGAEIAAKLVEEIRAMGLPAFRAGAGTTASNNDIVIRGYLISVREGSEAKRIGFGLGAGSSELKAAVEAYQMTAAGLRKLGSADMDATGNKTPGTAVGLVSFLATHNPAGLIVSTGMKVYDEESGKGKVEGRADQVAKEIGAGLKKQFKAQGWL